MQPGADDIGLDADAAVTALFDEHYARLVRTAVVLLRDPTTAHDIVQDAFVGLHGAWGRLQDRESAAGYLHRSVVNAARSRLRRRSIAARHQPEPPGAAASAEDTAMPALTLGPVANALRALPRRQREVVLLRHYLDLSEAQTAHALGIRPGSVKSYGSKGLATLRHTLETSGEQS